jgi:hypothetical protein
MDCIKVTGDESKREVLRQYLETANKDGKTPLTLLDFHGKIVIIRSIISDYNLCICDSPGRCDFCS